MLVRNFIIKSPSVKASLYIITLLKAILLFQNQLYAFNLFNNLTGFIETSGSYRIVENDTDKTRWLLGEVRLQLDYTKDTDDFTISLKPELIFDGTDRQVHFNFREAYILLPLDYMDIKLGRQIITWGTGDFVFLNDVFPKDWQSFFMGRDDEYLKKPANAIRWTIFLDNLSFDIAWLPFFTADQFISGERLSYYDPFAGTISGPLKPEIDPDYPRTRIENGEIAGRVSGTVGSWELAAYGYRGRWGTPKGFSLDSQKPFFPRLEVWGSSIRGPVKGGILNAEVAWYRSLDDLNGSNPFVPNSEIRWLLGYSHEIISDQSIGLQAYVEQLLDFAEYEKSGGERDRERLWLTLRYTGLFLQQNLTISFFGFFAPIENDLYCRPKIAYKYSDNVTLTLGANIFLGSKSDTFFGQFEENTNVYARVRYFF